MSGDEFVTTQEAAQLLGVSVRSVQLWVENGVLHAWKTAGGHRRIARASVEELLAKQREVIETVAGLRLVDVLIIEEDPAYVELYRLKLESGKVPVSVSTALNGYDGLLEAGRSGPQIVIARLELAGIDGLRMLQALRDQLPDAALIVLTELGDEEIQQRGRLPVGADVIRPTKELERLDAVLAEKLKAAAR